MSRRCEDKLSTCDVDRCKYDTGDAGSRNGHGQRC